MTQMSNRNLTREAIMRGTRAKRLRAPDRPNPGRKMGGMQKVLGGAPRSRYKKHEPVVHNRPNKLKARRHQ